MNSDEKNVIVAMMNQLKINKTILRSFLNLAIKHDKNLVPITREAIETSEDTIEMARELIEKNHNNRNKKG